MQAVAIQADMGQWGQVQAMSKQTVKQLGKLDIVVNNAGVTSIKPVEELTLED